MCKCLSYTTQMRLLSSGLVVYCSVGITGTSPNKILWTFFCHWRLNVLVSLRPSRALPSPSCSASIQTPKPLSLNCLRPSSPSPITSSQIPALVQISRPSTHSHPSYVQAPKLLQLPTSCSYTLAQFLPTSLPLSSSCPNPR